MSLLLEALKKAERAKHEAQRAAHQATSEGSDAFSLSPNDETRHVVTRDELPDITRPVLIESSDISAPENKPPLESGVRSPSPDPLSGAHSGATPEDAIASRQSAARKVFEAKFREPNPKLPFYITMAVLVALTLGTGIYFWYQLRPPPPLVNPDPPKQGNEPVPAAPVPQGASSSKTDESPVTIPGLPQAVPGQTAQVAASTPVAGPAPVAATAAQVPAAGPQRASGQAASALSASSAKATPNPSSSTPSSGSRGALSEKRQGTQAQDSVTSTRTAASIHPRVESGYAAFLRGDIGTARESYLQALKDDPHNRDALLGLAATETAAKQFEVAEHYYQRMLQADPRDANAIAGILALRGSMIDPVSAESRMKSMLASDPEAAALNFSLGNQLAQQARWSEAQQAYFRAYTADPENPDLAYNLAVSLDHIRQVKLALQYYRRALTLADKRPGGFSVPAARGRVAELEK